MTTNPTDDEVLNYNLPRAKWALAIIDAYAAEQGGIPWGLALKEILSTFEHGADFAGLDYSAISEEAHELHDEEVKEESGEEFDEETEEKTGT